MQLIVSVRPEKSEAQGDISREFVVEDELLPVRFLRDLEFQLAGYIMAEKIIETSILGNVISVKHSPGLPKEWYVRVIDAVKDSVGPQREVLSRLSSWP